MGGSHTTETALAGVQVQTSLLAQPITIGWGRSKISCNLIDYVGFKATPQTTKQGGKGGSSSSTTYTYTASVVMALCEGPIADVVTVYKDSSVFTNGSTTALAQAGLSLATGTLTQSPWGYLTSLYPSHALSYSTTAYVYAQDYALGSDATLSNHSFEVDFAIQMPGLPDANPRDIVTDYLTNVSYGVTGWTSGLVADWSNWSQYCQAANLLLSPVLDSATTGADFLTQISQETNSEFFWSEGVLKVKPYGDAAVTANGATWTPNLSPVYDLNEDDFLSEVVHEIVDQSDAYNYVQVEWLDRTNQYQPAVMPAQDLDNIVTFGLRKRDAEQFHHICDGAIAQQVAQLRLQRTLYIRDLYHIDLPEDFVAVEPMDYLTLTTTVDGMQLNRQLVLVKQIDEDENGSLKMVTEAVPGQAASAAAYAAHVSGGYQPAVDVAPGNVSTPFVFSAPTTLATTQNEIWCAVSGGVNWGGCNVWLSLDNASYTQIGTVGSPARYGVLSSALPDHADPDTVDTLSVDLTLSGAALASVTTAEADGGASLCLIDNELLTYATATLTAANHYNLTYLRRGQRNTSAAAHASNAPFIRLDGAIFKYGYPTSNIGETIYLKFQSFNTYGRAVQDLSTLTPTTFTINPGAVIPDSFGLSVLGALIANSRVTGLSLSSTP